MIKYKFKRKLYFYCIPYSTAQRQRCKRAINFACLALELVHVSRVEAR